MFSHLIAASLGEYVWSCGISTSIIFSFFQTPYIYHNISSNMLVDKSVSLTCCIKNCDITLLYVDLFNQLSLKDSFLYNLVEQGLWNSFICLKPRNRLNNTLLLLLKCTIQSLMLKCYHFYKLTNHIS